MNLSPEERKKCAPKGLTEEELADALMASHGVISHAAKVVGIDRDSFLFRINHSARLKQVLITAREEMLDIAEGGLFGLIKNGDYKSIAFMLRNVGASRGYGDKKEITIKNESNMDLSKLSEEELEKLNELIEKSNSEESEPDTDKNAN